MAGADHSRTLDPSSVQQLRQQTSTADSGGIWRNDTTSNCPAGSGESHDHDISDIDPYYRQSTIMTDTESQYSQDTVVASRTFWQRLTGKGRKRIGWSASLRATATFTCKPKVHMFIQLAQCGLPLRRA
jgi:hypothetical protein